VKLSPIMRAFKLAGFDHDYIDTGQHYDAELSTNLQREIGIKDPLVNLTVGSDSHSAQTARIMEKLEFYLDKLKPKILIVYGDTNSTLAATLVGAKKNIPIAHVESGLRSFNRNMPEEINRVVTDHLATYLFCPTETAVANLRNEGITRNVWNFGDVMYDQLLLETEKIHNFNPNRPGILNDYVVATIHRAENTDSKSQLLKIIDSFSKIDFQILLFCHPRLRSRLTELKLEFSKNVKLFNSIPHSELLGWLLASRGVITDSGGLQKEAFLLKIPCSTIRRETEWLETLANGWNILVPDIVQLPKLLNTHRDRLHTNPFGDGSAALKIVNKILSF